MVIAIRSFYVALALVVGALGFFLLRGCDELGCIGWAAMVAALGIALALVLVAGFVLWGVWAWRDPFERSAFLAVLVLAVLMAAGVGAYARGAF